MPFARGEAEGVPHDKLFWRTGHYQVALVDGWKLQVNERPPGTVWLFDLNTDPTEQHNLAASQPERVQAMRAILGRSSRTFGFRCLEEVSQEARSDAAELAEIGTIAPEMGPEELRDREHVLAVRDGGQDIRRPTRHAPASSGKSSLSAGEQTFSLKYHANLKSLLDRWALHG